jgi:hypothetical protein
LGTALMAVGCGRRPSPEEWQPYINQLEQQRAARNQQKVARMPMRPAGALTDSGRTISECRDGGPDWDYVCTRTYEFGRVHTTETIGYTLVPKGRRGKNPDRWSEKVLTQKHECPNGSSRPWSSGC